MLHPPQRPTLPARAALLLCFALVSLATLGFPGCPSLVTGPGPDGESGQGTMLTMSNCWPNDDGRFWRYDMSQSMLQGSGGTIYRMNETVPPVTLRDARRLLQRPVTSSGTEQVVFEMHFLGLGTTASGVTAQNLVESLHDPLAANRSAPAEPFAGAFLARLAEARPDLRAKLAARGVRAALAAADSRPYYRPYLVHGYIWSKSAQRIGTYGDVDTLLAWKFLGANVRPGSQFSFQLLPSLASDVWLHASIERVVSTPLPHGGVSDNALEVLYLIDYGVAVSVDAMGNPTGQFRTFDYGLVTYAPGTGPVRSRERRMAMVGEPETSLGFAEVQLRLADTGILLRSPPAVAARAH